MSDPKRTLEFAFESEAFKLTIQHTTDWERVKAEEAQRQRDLAESEANQTLLPEGGTP